MNHWGHDDPAAAEGSNEERLRAFQRVFRELETRIKLFTSLPLDSVDRTALRQRLREIDENLPTQA